MSAQTIALAVGTGACCAFIFSAGLQAGLFIGEKRGRALEKMEPPSHGQFHFREGGVVRLVADDATQAINRLVAPPVAQAHSWLNPRAPRLWE